MYDVIIVGAGPAGGSAALELATSDKRVLIVEKESLPRIKPCGGAMPSKIEKLLDIDISEIIKKRVQNFKIYYNYENEVDRYFKKEDSILLVDRSQFDLYLINEAVKKAVGKIEIEVNNSVVDIEERCKYVTVVLKDGKRLQTKYLIAADGALGKVASLAGLMKKREFATSYDIEIETNTLNNSAYLDTILINYYCLPLGYGWIFPKEKNRFSCGIGTWGKPFNMKGYLDHFLRYYFPQESISIVYKRGYPIPLYKGTEKIATKRVLLTGDAAALVDPVTGEGIRFALHSGKIAASVIVKAIDSAMEDSVESIYQQIINAEIGKELKDKRLFESLAFHNAPLLFYKKFVQ